MVELIDDGLNFSFPEVHPQARLRIEFQRTLRIPERRPGALPATRVGRLSAHACR